MYGKNLKKLKKHVGTRSYKQVRTHANNFFDKLEKKNQTMEEFFESLDMSNLRDLDYIPFEFSG